MISTLRAMEQLLIKLAAIEADRTRAEREQTENLNHIRDLHPREEDLTEMVGKMINSMNEVERFLLGKRGGTE